MVVICCVPGCGNTSSQVALHRFPKDKALFTTWVNNINCLNWIKESQEVILRNKRICSIHFGPEAISAVKRRFSNLKDDAVPTLLLPKQLVEQTARGKFRKCDGNPTSLQSGGSFLVDAEKKNTCGSTNFVPAAEEAFTEESDGSLLVDAADFHLDEDHDYGRETYVDGEFEEDEVPDAVFEMEINNNNLFGSPTPFPPEEELQMYSGPPSDFSCKEQIPEVHSQLRRRSNRNRKSLLSVAKARTVADLSPDARSFYKVASDLVMKLRYLEKKKEDLGAKIKLLEEDCQSLEFLRGKLNTKTFNFLLSQIRCQRLHPKGRRYTLDEKILFLSLFKSSPKGYRFFKTIFAAPSRKTLTKLIRTVKFETGINLHIMESIKKKVVKMGEKQKYCSILFDEMSIDPCLQYHVGKDLIEGFQDNGSLVNRCPSIADKVMVFMARGIFKKWKQPLAYFFNEGGMKSDVLATIIKAVVRSCQDSGLKVKTLICDQGSANVAAINKLYKETSSHYIRQGEENRMFGFLIGSEEVVPLYDPPHLLKGIRNNFVDNMVRFKWRKDHVEEGAWLHLKALYDLEAVEDFEYKNCKKISLQHIENTKKMKVSVAAQVLSNTVAAFMRSMAISNRLPKEALSTAEFILFMDKVFDSVNGCSLTLIHGKELRSGVTSKSPHRLFWAQAIRVFESMEFFNDRRNKFVPPSVKNWIHTLKGFTYVWNNLEREKVKFLLPRHMNQDPLENFFGNIRSHAVRNVNPNASSFSNSFISLIISNMCSQHSLMNNCEEDEFEALDDLKHMFAASVEDRNHENANIVLPDFSIPEYHSGNCDSLIRNGSLTYVAGYVAKKILKKIKSCTQCRVELIGGDRSQPEYFMIEAKAYSYNALLAPSTNFNSLFRKCIYLLSSLLPDLCHEKNLAKILFQILKHVCRDENIFHCQHHKVIDIFLKYLVNFHILIWSSNVNKILKGKKVLGTSADKIKIIARNKYIKHSKFLKRMSAQKQGHT